MKMEERHPFTILMSFIVLISGIMSAFAEVTSIQTDSATYDNSDQIKFSGTYEEDSSGLITIVIRDPNNEFVLLTQALMNPDNTFEKIVDIGPKFSLIGTYNATAFIYNITDGSTVNFGYGVKTSNSEPLQDTQTNETVIVSEPEGPLISENSEPIVEETTEISNDIPPKTPDFVDPTKDPKHYIDRYNNEPAYQEWFDKNYPNLTIEEAVGYEEVSEVLEKENEVENTNEELTENEINKEINSEIIPDAQASTFVELANEPIVDNSELSQLVLALAGLAVLFGAVYGIKRKVDSNTKQISENKNTIKKKFLGNILHNDPLEVIRDRLAKGEMSVDEYNKIKDALKNE